jgi:hypothetical protein
LVKTNENHMGAKGWWCIEPVSNERLVYPSPLLPLLLLPNLPHVVTQQSYLGQFRLVHITVEQDAVMITPSA